MKRMTIILISIVVVLCLGLGFIATGFIRPQKVEQTTTKETSSSSQTIDWSKASPDAKKYTIDFEEVVAAVGNGAKFYDVRDALEFQSGHFALAENLPLSELELGRFPEISKEKPIYLHCRSGRRSALAAQLFKEAGFQYVYDLGGLEQVEAIGGKIE
ncbi:rhodanese-like domain-containing protein [Streptococcus oriscaviae]|uniref:Rhodanese-like domain-containing protein n=1 Tax=Streptococcus oriscaviae TaxID=2781599 RepID=A0ABX7YL43_9STRE|nr:rhodanese-like domain-containing protein [Streptococcus oriscaviae]QUE54306.1 rhodanese-like domain-containing protein [Streptococcus oriscaviae]